MPSLQLPTKTAAIISSDISRRMISKCVCRLKMKTKTGARNPLAAQQARQLAAAASPSVRMTLTL